MPRDQCLSSSFRPEAALFSDFGMLTVLLGFAVEESLFFGPRAATEEVALLHSAGGSKLPTEQVIQP